MSANSCTHMYWKSPFLYQVQGTFICVLVAVLLLAHDDPRGAHGIARAAERVARAERQAKPHTAATAATAATSTTARAEAATAAKTQTGKLILAGLVQKVSVCGPALFTQEHKLTTHCVFGADAN